MPARPERIDCDADAFRVACRDWAGVVWEILPGATFAQPDPNLPRLF